MTPSTTPTDAAEKVVAELRSEADAMHAAVAGVTLGDTFHAANWSDKPHRVLYDALKHMRRAAAIIESQRATIERVERERDEARALATAQNGGNRHASAEWTKTLLKLREAQKERDAIVAAGETLSEALSRYGFPMSDEAWRNTGDAAPTNSQASVEARALHQAAAAFFREVSGAANVG